MSMSNFQKITYNQVYESLVISAVVDWGGESKVCKPTDPEDFITAQCSDVCISDTGK